MTPSARKAYPPPPKKQTLQKQRWEEMRKLKGSQECSGKLYFPCPFKLTRNISRMIRLADVEVPGGGLSTSITHGHGSSGSPSIRLLCLRDCSHSLQIRRASRLATSSGARVPHTQVLISVPPDSVEERRWDNLAPETSARSPLIDKAAEPRG
jgi:hypothetical protein